MRMQFDWLSQIYICVLFAMPSQNAIWKVEATPEPQTVSKFATEKDLEDRDEHRTSNSQH